MATLKPASMAEASSAIQDALKRRESLEVLGLASKRAIGRPSEATDILDLSFNKGIVLYEPQELVLTAKAGTSIAEISTLLADKGQMLAFEPPDFGELLGTGSGSLGGVFAANFSGPRRLKAGAARDFILGFTGLNGRGEAFRAGGRVVKNVTGYDLPKLMCGSWGTLAVMDEITVKVMPKPETEVSVGIAGLSHEAAIKATTVALQSPAEISSAAYLPQTQSAESRTMLRIEGVDASVKARTSLLQELLKSYGSPLLLEEAGSGDFWRNMRDVLPLASLREAHIWRISVPPTESAAVMTRISDRIEARFYCDWSGGLVWLAVSPNPEAHGPIIREAIAGSSGHATLIRAPQSVRRNVPVFQPQPKALAALTRRVKASFDPERVLNRSRMYEGV
jgi:glycolate oxidase FAD binding subunit